MQIWRQFNAFKALEHPTHGRFSGGLVELIGNGLLAYSEVSTSKFRDMKMLEFIQWERELTKLPGTSGKQLIILSLDNGRNKPTLGSRQLNDYCRLPIQIRGTLLQDGEVLSTGYHKFVPRLTGTRK